MRILHTSDWHVGRTLKGAPRIDEHAAVLAEIVAVARDRAVDVVLVAGDLFETAAPSPEAQALVWRTLLDLRGTGAQVVVVAGNHDNPHAFEAFRPVCAAAGITVLGHCARPDDGGLVEVVTSAGERARVALLPFVPQRHVVRAADLLSGTGADHAGTYADRLGEIVAALTATFAEPGAVNLVVSHAMVLGGVLGGGEREAHTINTYWLPATRFPSTAHYVALGHLHRTQQLPAACPVWYSGSPIAVDFGEEADAKHVLVVEATATTPAVVEQVPLRAGLRLRTVRGTMAQLRAEAVVGVPDNVRLRVFVREAGRAGLADEVRALFPNAVDVILERPEGDEVRRTMATRSGLTPQQLFDSFLNEREIADPRLAALFAELLDAATVA